MSLLVYLVSGLSWNLPFSPGWPSIGGNFLFPSPRWPCVAMWVPLGNGLEYSWDRYGVNGSKSWKLFKSSFLSGCLKSGCLESPMMLIVCSHFCQEERRDKLLLHGMGEGYHYEPDRCQSGINIYEKSMPKNWQQNTLCRLIQDGSRWQEL